MGQTKRQLRTRIREHKSNIKQDASRHNVLVEHIFCDHMFDWSSVKILDQETNYKKRLISEMTHIKVQKIGINL